MTASRFSTGRLAAAFLTVAATVLPVHASQARLQSGVERPGGTYEVKDALADENACLKACTDDAKCVAYTFVRAGFQGKRSRCWLKSKVTPTWKTGKADCCVSGVKGYKGVTDVKVFDNVVLSGPEGSSGTYGLDLCKEGGASCGWPAAQAYCESQGFAKAVDYEVVRDTPPTRAISDGFVCNQKFCHRIAQVVCGNAELTTD